MKSFAQHTLKTLALVIALSAATPAAARKSAFAVTHLTVEHMSDPMTVDARQPRLSWINEVGDPDVRGERQTAYRIVVASSRERLLAGDYDLWDSGRVPSDASTLVPYGGRALASGQDCYWRVQTWNSRRQPSAWSPVGHWGMGLLDASDWHAQWIATPQEAGAPLFRHAFALRRPVRQAKAFVTAGGYFELYVNGRRVGEDCLVPNFTNYSTRKDLDKGGIAIDARFTDYRVLYLAYDVTDLLREGRNAVGAILGDGFYRANYYIVRSFGMPCLLCQIEVTYDDGTRERICTDGSWLTRPSAITMTGVYDGEAYDARLETPHWAEADCDESGWQRAPLATPPTGALTAHTSPTDRVTERLQPLSVTPTDSSFVVTFEKEISGWVRLKGIRAPRGQRVDVRYICESPLGREEYICRGDGPESYAPRFTWYVFSQVEVKGLSSLSPEQIEAEAVNTDVRISADFHTSNDLVNRINAIWQRSQLDNMHGCIASDCPHRERSPYTGDGQVAAAMVMLNFDAAAFYQKWLRDMRDAQDPVSGYVPNGAPWQPTCGGGVAWGAAMNVIPWDYYLAYGDRDQLQLCYRPMREQLRHMLQWVTPDSTMFQQERNRESGDLCYWLNLGDWVPPYGRPSDEVIHTFYLWLCASNTAEAARVLGDGEGAAECQAVADRTWRAFHRKFYDPEQATYGDFGPNILALYMGVPEERREAVIASLRREIMQTHDGHINTGFVTTKHFFEVLTDNGLHDVATTAMLKTDFPSYGHWLAQGATVTWENWDGRESRNHPMFGGGLTWFARRLAGIRATAYGPDFSSSSSAEKGSRSATGHKSLYGKNGPSAVGAGYRHFEVRPVPAAGIDTVSYSLLTPQGRVSSYVVSHEGHLQRLSVTVPVGSTATVALPPSVAVSERGRRLRPGHGILHVSSDRAIIGQGSYNFEFSSLR